MSEFNKPALEDDCQHIDYLGMDDSCNYEIKVQGHLDHQWADWFGQMDIHLDPCGITVLSGMVVDQSALHGILARIRDLGLILVSVTRIRQIQA